MATSNENVLDEEQVPAGRLLICGQCYELKGPVPGRSDGAQQLCSCSPMEVHCAQPTWGSDHNTYAELCRCCGLVLLKSGSKWSLWFCSPCKDVVQDLNQAAGRCVIPIGRHSLMNNVAARTTQLQSKVAVVAYVDQLRSLFVNMEDLYTWASTVVQRNLAALNLDAEADGALSDYLDEIKGSSLTQAAAFETLAAVAHGGDRKHGRS
jgi:hypothetical protein